MSVTISICMRCGHPFGASTTHICEPLATPVVFRPNYRVVLDSSGHEICDRCEKPRSAHGGEQLFCPFYSTYRARRR